MPAWAGIGRGSTVLGIGAIRFLVGGALHSAGFLKGPDGIYKCVPSFCPGIRNHPCEPWTKELRMAIALLEIPMSGWLQCTQRYFFEYAASLNALVVMRSDGRCFVGDISVEVDML